MARILVTGGTGFIGSHTICQLLKEGYNVISVDNFSGSEPFINDLIYDLTGVNSHFFRVDITNYEQLKDVFDSFDDIDAVIHFAAFKSVPESIKFPIKYYNNNLNGLNTLLTLCDEKNVRKIVFSSSCTVYGKPEKLPISEDQPFRQTLSPYGLTKKISEEILMDLCCYDSRWQIISLRYFNPVGAHPSGKLGELPLGVPNNLMPYVTQTAAGVHECLYIYGNDYNTPDGTAIRDYIHIIDLADAHLKALLRLLSGKQLKSYEVYNLGTGRGYSVLEVVKAFEKINKISLPYKIVARRPGDLDKIWADPSKAIKDLNWYPKYSLEDIVEHAWKWEKFIRFEFRNKSI